MIRKFNLKSGEIIQINEYVEPHQLFSMKGVSVIKGLYFATPDGIYIAKNRWKRAGKIFAIYGIVLAIFLLMGMAFIGGYMVMSSLQPLSYLTIFPLVVGLAMFVSAIYLIIRAVKYAKKVARTLDYGEGELVVPWNMVKTIVVTDTQTESISLLNPQFREVGAWRVLTIDGGEIVIWPVYNPYEKLEYVKRKFNLTF